MMLRNVKNLRGYVIRAIDGTIGKLDDFYFDDEDWSIRYLVVDTGSWLSGRKVLISPVMVGHAGWLARRLPVALTRAQVEHSPGIDTRKPVSRQHEARRPRRRRCRHAQPGRRERAGLAHGELSRSSTHHDDTPICGAIPAVHQVALATPECPDREVEPERRHWTQHERERCLTVTHHVDSRIDRRGSSAATTRVDFAGRALQQYLRAKATALLCSVSCEL